MHSSSPDSAGNLIKASLAAALSFTVDDSSDLSNDDEEPGPKPGVRTSITGAKIEKSIGGAT
ncbi:MAG: hypothetical protein GY822_10705 [Deltaproteobacteria bacterium]|nr:hypothetical protein [Deltaproteobacteria bacterium]